MGTIRLFNHYIRKDVLLAFAAEFLICTLSAYAVLLMRLDSWNPGSHYGSLLHSAAGYASVTVLGMVAMGLYRHDLHGGLPGVLLRVAVSFPLSVAVLSIFFYLLPEIEDDRLTLVITFAFSLLVIAAVRAVVMHWLGPRFFRRRVLVVGAGENARSLLDMEHEANRLGCDIVGVVHVPRNRRAVNTDRIVNVDRPLLEYVTERGIDEVVVALDERRGCVPIEELTQCRDAGIHVTDLVAFFERELGKLRLDLISPSYLVFSEGFQRRTLYAFVKRFTDLSVGLVALAVVWPLMIFTVLAIVGEDGWRSPIIYRQVRVGQNGKPFRILKFRSMLTDAEADMQARWADRNDTRITRVGRFIRKHRIDELPQLFNVVRGDMSFVGPRPERPEFVQQLVQKVPFYERRHAVKVGISGWAQLCYPYGDSERDAAEKLQYDLYYIKNQSLFLDILIMIQTAEAVLFARGSR